MRAQGVEGGMKVPVLGYCSPSKLVEKTSTETLIGELRTEPDTIAAQFIYGGRADSDISVALRASGGHWSLSGEHHVGNSGGSAVTKRADRGQHLLVQSSFEYGRYEQTCYGKKHETVRSLGWRGGEVTGRPTAARGCSYARPDHTFRFDDDTAFDRDKERSVTWVAAASAFGASLTARSGYSQFVKAHWDFGKEPLHLLCGDNANPSNSSHIFAGESMPAEGRCQPGRAC
jgi:hypothetical protein